jgi:hypothetical protein
MPEAAEVRDIVGSVAMRGLRVAIGCAIGEVEVRLGAARRRLVYSGPAVERAAQTAALAAGGQLLLTSQCVDALGGTVGLRKLRGIAKGEPIIHALGTFRLKPGAMISASASSASLPRGDGNDGKGGDNDSNINVDRGASMASRGMVTLFSVLPRNVRHRQFPNLLTKKSLIAGRMPDATNSNNNNNNNTNKKKEEGAALGPEVPEGSGGDPDATGADASKGAPESGDAPAGAADDADAAAAADDNDDAAAVGPVQDDAGGGASTNGTAAVAEDETDAVIEAMANLRQLFVSDRVRAVASKLASTKSASRGSVVLVAPSASSRLSRVREAEQRFATSRARTRALARRLEAMVESFGPETELLETCAAHVVRYSAHVERAQTGAAARRQVIRQLAARIAKIRSQAERVVPIFQGIARLEATVHELIAEVHARRKAMQRERRAHLEAAAEPDRALRRFRRKFARICGIMQLLWEWEDYRILHLPPPKQSEWDL